MNTVNVILGAQSLILILASAPVTPLILETAAPVNMTIAANPVIAAVIPEPVQYVVTAQSNPALNFNVSMTGDGKPGDQGIQGPPGPRGSLFLGKYPDLASLPPVDGVDIRLGDYAYLNDSGELWILKG